MHVLFVQVICAIKHEKPILASCFNPADDTQFTVMHSNGASMIRLDGETGASRPLLLSAVVRE
jgi:hypothetical protein